MNKIRKAVKRLKYNEEEIESALKKWDAPDYKCSEHILEEMFYTRNENVTIEKEFTRICLLNQVYGTHLSTKELYDMACAIRTNFFQIDDSLNKGTEEAVQIITNALRNNNQGRHCYVFATKYCSFSSSDEHKNDYPIFDSYMSEIYKRNRTRWEGERLKALKLSQSTFDSAIKDDSTVAKKYMDYKKAVGGMLAHVNKITERISTVKELDQYLWMAVNTILGELK